MLGLKDTQSITAPGRCLDDFCAEQGIDGIDLLKIDVEGFEGNVLSGAKMIDHSKVTCIQLEYGNSNLFSRVFIHDYILEYGEAFAIGKLYSNGVRRFEGYDASLDDLVETNLVMVARKQPQLIELLTLTSDVHL